MADSFRKGRSKNPPAKQGSAHGCARLTEADVVVIRQRLVTGENQHRIADDYGVANTTISIIARGATWGHV